MTQISTITDRDAFGPPPVSAGYKVDISRGERIGRVSSEWFSRPDDERYLSLSALYAAVRARADRATARTVEARTLRVEASRDDAERLALIVPGREEPIAPTHWSFGQMCSLVGAPAGYMRQLPAPLAGINMQHGLLSHRAELVKTLEADDGRIELRAVTGPDYGRIWDHELVAAVMKIAGEGTGDTRWKVPGLLDWSTMTHNPFVEVTKDTTTLYASDRDVFLFLVDDAHPIEAGRLPNGDPDLYFRGFYCWNSEVGSKTLGMASFYLRTSIANSASIDYWRRFRRSAPRNSHGTYANSNRQDLSFIAPTMVPRSSMSCRTWEKAFSHCSRRSVPSGNGYGPIAWTDESLDALRWSSDGVGVTARASLPNAQTALCAAASAPT